MSISSKDLRAQFLKNKKTTSFNYMGIKMADSEVKKGDTFNDFYLPESTPGNQLSGNF
jgi:hypothetical protein